MTTFITLTFAALVLAFITAGMAWLIIMCADGRTALARKRETRLGQLLRLAGQIKRG